MNTAAPRLSVIVRSLDRLASLGELTLALLAQDHDAFEIVIVDQSAPGPARDARLLALAADPRVRILRHGRLGSARARNVGVAAARGAVLVFIDDDDLPGGPEFLRRIEAPFADPECAGVTGRHLWSAPGAAPSPPSWLYRFLAARRVMRFSPLLALPWTFARHDRPVRGTDYVHGTGAAIRASAAARVGGWDEDAPLEDESSFGYRAKRALGPAEYFAFDPSATVIRRLDLDGGLAKRALGPTEFLARTLTFVRRIVGRYHPRRVRWLYPLYVFACVRWTLEWLWSTSRRHSSPGARVWASLGLVARAPVVAAQVAAREPIGGAAGGAQVPGAEGAAAGASSAAASASAPASNEVRASNP